MIRRSVLVLLAALAALTGACRSHLDLQYTPARYAQLREIELVLAPPARPYRVVALVEGSGGRFTTRDTLINVLIDEAKKAGAEALLPPEFTGEGGRSQTGLEQFFYPGPNQRPITRGRAIRWVRE